MKSQPKRIVKSEGAPLTNELWLTPNGELKEHVNGQWKVIPCGSSSSPQESPSSSNETTSSSALVVIGSLENIETGPSSFILFVPAENEPTLSEAAQAMRSGRLVYMNIPIADKNGIASVNVLCLSCWEGRDNPLIFGIWGGGDPSDETLSIYWFNYSAPEIDPNPPLA